VALQRRALVIQLHTWKWQYQSWHSVVDVYIFKLVPPGPELRSGGVPDYVIRILASDTLATTAGSNLLLTVDSIPAFRKTASPFYHIH
jgi:hypothetical protein